MIDFWTKNHINEPITIINDKRLQKSDLETWNFHYEYLFIFLLTKYVGTYVTLPIFYFPL